MTIVDPQNRASDRRYKSHPDSAIGYPVFKFRHTLTLVSEQIVVPKFTIYNSANSASSAVKSNSQIEQSEHAIILPQRTPRAQRGMSYSSSWMPREALWQRGQPC